MPNCPNCNSFYFGSPESCPDCHYNFAAKRVIQPNTMGSEQIKAEVENLEKIKERTLLQNPRYEYHTEFITDNYTGRLDQNELNETLARYANNGWKLHTIFVNEAGKTGSAFGIGGVSSGINSTMDVTVLVFERCIKPAEYSV